MTHLKIKEKRPPADHDSFEPQWVSEKDVTFLQWILQVWDTTGKRMLAPVVSGTANWKAKIGHMKIHF